MNMVGSAYDVKLTENGASALSTTGSALLNLYAVCGALRTRDEHDICDMMSAAWKEDALSTLRLAFYCRNIRGGLGERRTGRIMFKWLAANHPTDLIANLKYIPFFGRWDDMLMLHTNVSQEVTSLIQEQFLSDMKNAKEEKPISLLAKWAPSINASSQATRELATELSRALNLTPKAYRKMLSALRAYLKVVETKMSAQEWENIQYSTVPSYAMKLYRNSFKKHDEDGFASYIEKVNNGKEKINASTLFPYDIVYNLLYKNLEEDAVLDAQWAALPNYIEKPLNAIVMADVSGSMYGMPISSSIGLAIYFAQHNFGTFHNLYMTFTDRPSFIRLKENTQVSSLVEQVRRTSIGYSTNLDAAFNALLKMAISSHASQEEMPKALIVISDMEIDSYAHDEHSFDFVENQRKQFAEAGYEIPKIIMWNVDARQDTYLANGANSYVQFVSGQSAAIFKTVIDNIQYNAYDAMMNTINDKQYQVIQLANI